MPNRYFLAGDLRRFAPVVVVVMALHAALLAVPLRSARAPGASMAATAMQVRLLDAQAGDSAASQATAPRVTGNDIAAPPQQPAQSTAIARTAPADASPPQPLLGWVAPGTDSDADYYPRAALSLAPAPVDAIVLDYPPIANDSGHHVGQLSLFIDQAGRVDRVRVDGQPLPPELEQAARTAFMGARFRAGEVDGRAVKSRIRIEVVFDSRPPGSLK